MIDERVEIPCEVKQKHIIIVMTKVLNHYPRNFPIKNN